ncbi:MAG: tetratricopeptide repeat protein [Bacteroidetes bacterium]|nr:tetratricopeptide repeat protein [Bacteroidota bacterium]
MKKKLSGKHAVNGASSATVRPYIPLLIILAATFIIFLPVLGNGLILWDDHSYTYENPFLKSFSFREVFSFSTFYLGNYHPLTLLWLHCEWLVFPHGDPDLYAGVSPFWFHLNNILLHLVNVTLVFFLVYELTDRKGWKSAAFTAALFAVHPMHVESVVWVSELKDVLYGAFYLGGAMLYICYLKTEKSLLLGMAFLLFILSNLAKAQAVTLPVLFFLFDYYKGRKISIRLFLEKIPFLVLSLFFGILAIRAQVEVTALNEQHPVSVSSALNACYGLMTYLFKLVVPVHLSAVHPYTYSQLGSFPWYFFLLPALLILLVFFAFRSLRRTKDFLFGFFFYLITVSVMIKLVPVGDSLINERYTYIPYIGLFFIAGQLYARFSQPGRWKYLSLAATIAILVIFSMITVQRSKIWKDNLTFWNDVIEKYPGYWRGYFGVGLQQYNSGNYQEALEYADKSCERNPPAVPYMLRGTIYLNQVKNDSLAIVDFQKVISLHEPSSPFDAEARYNLGIAYENRGEYAEALKVFDEAVIIAPNNPKGYVLKGINLTRLGQYSQAESVYTEAIRVSSGTPDAWLRRGILYEDNLNRYDEAIADFRKVLEIEPGRRDATVNIAISLYKKQSYDEAVRQCDHALGLFPDDGQVYYIRALANEGRRAYAEAYRDALKARQAGYAVNEKYLEKLSVLAK